MSQTKKHALTATSAIFLSRIMGLVREQVFAVFFGAGAALDAFVVAFRIPNLLRDLFAEGALSQSFVAIFSQKLASENKENAYRLANKIFTFIFVLMGILVAVGMIFSSHIVSVIASGFEGEKFSLTVHLMRIMFPFIFFVSLAAVMMGMLNAQHKFFIPHSASTFFNFISITSGLLFAWLLSPDYVAQTFLKIKSGQSLITQDYLAGAGAIAGMALGTVLGGIGQYLVQMPTALKLGFRPKMDFHFKDSDLIKVLKLTGPAIIGGAAVQVNVLVNTEFASLLADGSISWLNFAFRFMQFPLGVFGVAIATASAPALARLIVQNKTDEFKTNLRSSINLSVFFSIPSAVGLIVLGPQIIGLIYEHGHFTTFDTQQTSLALSAYALGIASYSLIKIYQPAFLSFHDARIPMRVALLSILTNAAINGWFVLGLGLPHWALALGTAIVAGVNVFLLAVLFKRKLAGIWTRQVWLHLLKVLLISALMGALTWFVQDKTAGVFDANRLFDKLMRVGVPVLVAVVFYFGMGFLLGVEDARQFVKKIMGR